MLPINQASPAAAFVWKFAALLTGLWMMTSCDSGARPAVSDMPTPTDPPLEKSADSPMFQVISRFHAPMLDCMARVWPGAVEPYRRAQILMTGAAGDDFSYRWRAEANGFSIAQLEAARLEAAWFAPYNFGVFEGLPTLGVNYDLLSRDLVFADIPPEDIDAVRTQAVLETIFHESFHLFGQDNFGEPTGGRDQEYPIAWQPRYLRAQLLQTLQNAMTEGAGLGPSAWWYSRYLSEHLDEALYLDYVDRSEGSAEYAAKVMGGLAKFGCGVPESFLLDDLKADFRGARYYPDASTESYDLGFVAGLLLRERAVAGWEDQVAAGASMLEVLLAGVEAEPQPVDVLLQRQLSQQVNEENQRIGSEFEAGFNALEDAANYRLVFDLGASEGAFERTESYRLADHTEVNTFTRLISADIRHESLIALRSTDVFQLHKIPCEDAYLLPYVVPIDPVGLDSGKGVFTMTGGGAAFEDLPARVVDAEGYRWLCPPAASTLAGKMRAPVRVR